MAKKRISKHEASSKYGVIVTGANSMLRYYLCDDGSVVDSVGDVRYKPGYREYYILRKGNYPNEVTYEKDGRTVEFETFEEAYDTMCRLYMSSLPESPARFGIWEIKVCSFDGKVNSMTQPVWAA